MKLTVLKLRDPGDKARLHAALSRRGVTGRDVAGASAAAVVVEGPLDPVDLPGVEAVWITESDTPQVDQAPPTVSVAGIEIGGDTPVLIAGPCAVESPEVLDAVASAVASAGGRILRGGAFKPRTSPYSFQGLGREGLVLLREAADRHGLAVVTEALSVPDVPVVSELADMLQVGSRSMQHFPLLRAVGRQGKPVLLKRGASASVEEWLLAAEYLLDAGAEGVVLCERGIRAFGSETRYTLDLGAVAWVLEHTSLPVVVDPSHAAGHRELVPRLARAALALGAHGLMVEAHEDPGAALSDGPQALDLRTLIRLGTEVLR
jgi:3-deoxy-7-phosphoheptulonate synthase